MKGVVMKYILVSVYDSKAKIYSPVSQVENDTVATRMFSDLVNSADSVIEDGLLEKVDRVAICNGVDLKQDFRDEADINKLVNRFSETGQFYDPLTNQNASQRQPMFGDFTCAPDYQAACDLVLEANARFEALPSDVRERFGNDPAKLLAFLDDDDNRAEAVKLGLVNAPPEPPTTPPTTTAPVTE
ncbi:unnamed protein product [Cylicocyclus nassatus]|uniref:Minor capsid protein n=1 Tax=Cylicocyclus nassatus TaxID=53992 RepID=A0AA36GQF7_CYLNA|nr:unnamed protein product [Cylicocyclus nassatus]CAJ0596426.1 unnamed protein product [Cylicocyclus nassatus]CAJ0596427.1 unnamed protein product [Cylicocyclus nassatus]